MMTFGDELEPFRAKARQAVMDFYVAIALKDQRPPTQRAMDTRKAAEARLVSEGGYSDLLTREAKIRTDAGTPITVQQLAQLVLSMAADADRIELDRVEVSLQVDAASGHLEILDVLAKKGIPMS